MLFVVQGQVLFGEPMDEEGDDMDEGRMGEEEGEGEQNKDEEIERGAEEDKEMQSKVKKPRVKKGSKEVIFSVQFLSCLSIERLLFVVGEHRTAES